MKDWKIVAIVIATAIATAVAVAILLQKQNNKRKMRFDSAEFDDDCLDDIACGEQCTCCGDDLDVVLPEEAAPVEEEPVEEIIEDVIPVEEEILEAPVEEEDAE